MLHFIDCTTFLERKSLCGARGISLPLKGLSVHGGQIAQGFPPRKTMWESPPDDASPCDASILERQNSGFPESTVRYKFPGETRRRTTSPERAAQQPLAAGVAKCWKGRFLPMG